MTSDDLGRHVHDCLVPLPIQLFLYATLDQRVDLLLRIARAGLRYCRYRLTFAQPRHGQQSQQAE
jgi:hypothetical protein